MSDPMKPERTLVQKNGYEKCHRCKTTRLKTALYETILHGKVAYQCVSADKVWCGAEAKRKGTE